MTETVEETAYVTDGNLTWINEKIRDKYDCSPYRIPLRNKHKIIVEYSLVDAEDFEKVMKYKCCLSKHYAQTYVDKKVIPLHHYVFIKPKTGNMIDHLDEDKLNNSKLNLREITRNINEQNKSKKITDKHTSKYKGVCYIKTIKKYSAECRNNKKSINLGYFDNEFDAAIAYDQYSFHIYGKEANNNKLVTYENAISIDILTLIKNKNRKLPLNIRLISTKYYARKLYNKKEYCNGKGKETLDEAIKDLQIINVKINYAKVIEEFMYLQQPILKNKDGIAIVVIEYNNSETKNKEKIEALVDDNKWHILNRIKWHYSKGYLQNSKYSMHRFLMNAKENEIVDHNNNIKYDNRLSNLSIVNYNFNGHNKLKSKNASSKYYGVSFSKDRNKWRAVITKEGKHYVLGLFDIEIEAAYSYNIKAKELYGDHANLNIINV